MDLPTLLLGLLRRPASGYDLKAELDRRGRHYWSARQSQIYGALKRLESEGLISTWRARSPRGPPRRLASLTAEGRRALARRLEAGPAPARERLPWLAQVRVLAGIGPPAQQQRFLLALRRRLAQEQQALERQVADLEQGPPADADARFARAAARCGLATAAARLTWCDETLAALEDASAPG